MVDTTGAYPRDPQLTYCDEAHPEDATVLCTKENPKHIGMHTLLGTSIYWPGRGPLTKPEREKVKGAARDGTPPIIHVGPPSSAEVLPPIVRTNDPINSHVAAEQIEPTRGSKRAAVLDYLRQRMDQWVDAPDLATQEVGGFGGTRRMRELRQMGWNIETRQKPGEPNTWQHRLAAGLPAQEVAAGLRDFG